jgi:hypothetical protein
MENTLVNGFNGIAYKYFKKKTSIDSLHTPFSRGTPFFILPLAIVDGPLAKLTNGNPVLNTFCPKAGRNNFGIGCKFHCQIWQPPLQVTSA